MLNIEPTPKRNHFIASISNHRTHIKESGIARHYAQMKVWSSYHLLKFQYVLHVKLLLFIEVFHCCLNTLWFKFNYNCVHRIGFTHDLLHWYGYLVYLDHPQHRLSISQTDLSHRCRSVYHNMYCPTQNVQSKFGVNVG